MVDHPSEVFVCGHATNPDWRMALALAAAQVDAQAARRGAGAPPVRLGPVYLTEAYAPHAQALLDDLRERWPGVHWVGCAAVGVAAGGVEYMGEPALVLMLCPLQEDDFEVFSGTRPLSARAATRRWCTPTRRCPRSMNWSTNSATASPRATCSGGWFPAACRFRWPMGCGEAACRAWPSVRGCRSFRA